MNILAAPRHGDIVGPITGMLPSEEIETIPSHSMVHPCFPRRLCAGLFHRAPDACCLTGICPQVTPIF
jgi:hypothetical protein